MRVSRWGNVPCRFITGSAGTGKTTFIRNHSSEEGALKCATTGIAAVNLDTITINSLLKYFDTASLAQAYESRRLQKRLKDLAGAGCRRIVIDECSMLSAEQLDLIYATISEFNDSDDNTIGITGEQRLSFTGDEHESIEQYETFVAHGDGE